MIVTILVLGFLFGSILQYANLNRFNVISGMATLENLAVAKAILYQYGLPGHLLAGLSSLLVQEWPAAAQADIFFQVGCNFH